MPRNGSDIYFIPPGTEGFPDTTIESAKYNTYIHDVETDLNRPRPISAGGTGANDADEALANLGAEKSSQRVLNYDTHLFIPGSFYSAIGATGAPPAPAGQLATHAFVGWVVSSDIPAATPLNQNVVVHARNQNDITVPGRIYVREKKANVWGPWSIDGTGVVGPTPPADPPDGLLWWDNISGQLYVWYRDVDSAAWVIASPSPDPAQFLLKAGDKMEGTLELQAPPVADLQAANKKYVDDAVASGIGDTTSFVAKTGDTMTGPLALTGASGTINASGAIASAGYVAATHFVAHTTATTGTVYFGDGGSKYLTYDGTTYSLIGGGLSLGSGNVNIPGTVNSGGFQTAPDVLSTLGAIKAQRTGGGGIVYFGTNYIVNDGTNTILSGMGDFQLSGRAGSFWPPSGYNGGFWCKTGDGNGHGSNYFNWFWTGSSLNCYIGTSLVGTLFVSDYRAKKEVEPLPSTWDAVKALRPIKYKHQDFTPPLQASKEAGTPSEPLVKGDEEERWGFLAHELQETLVKDAASGEKDMPNGLQNPNAFPVIAALTKALQEAMARIEALEAGA